MKAIMYFLFLLSFLPVYSNIKITLENIEIKTIAPEGITEKNLGKVYDQKFNSIPGVTLKGSINSFNEPSYTAEFIKIENLVQVEANARVIPFFSASVAKSTETRYAVLNICKIKKYVTFEPDEINTPKGSFYLSKIYYGWTVSYSIESDISKMNNNVAVKLINWGADGNFKNINEETKCEWKLSIKGLDNKDNSFIALSINDVESKFKETKTLVPIMVEYKQFNPIETEEISWDMKFGGKFRLVNVYYNVSIDKYEGNSKKQWDAGFGKGIKPDIRFELYMENDGNKLMSSQVNEDSQQGNFYGLNIPVTITPASKLYIKFYDRDNSVLGGADDYIGKATAIFNNNWLLGNNNEIEIPMELERNNKNLNGAKIILKKE